MGTVRRWKTTAAKQGKIILKKSSSKRGGIAEELACNYLKKNFGMVLLDRNYRTPHGEIDLVMEDGDTMVFIEVRSREKETFLQPLESIDRNKCMRIIRSSEYYLQRNVSSFNSMGKCRFDVVTLTGPLETARLEWIKNAFEA